MKLFKRGPLFLVYQDDHTGFIYDSLTGQCSGDIDCRSYLGTYARHWLPVRESDPVPDGLRARLVIPFKAKTP
jgi:hypothetical protein